MEWSNAIALITIVVTILIDIFSREHNDNIRFMDAFNKIYSKTFSLRTEMSRISQKFFSIDFYYEIDIINSNMETQEKILDYMTEAENFFNSIFWHFLTKRTLKKLVSLAFYQRIAMLYSFLLYRRRKTRNEELFKNYCKAVKMMHKIPKVKNQINKSFQVCYIGIRESDINFSNNYFDKSVCIFSSKPEIEPFSKRLNQNIDNKEILPYYISQSMQIHQENPKCKFMFYNPATAYHYPNEILKNSICVNKQELLTLLNNKLSLKKWLIERKIPVIPYETFLGREVLFSNLSSHFKESNSFVIQCCHGGGGIGTYLVDKENFSRVSKNLQSLQQYIVSPYIRSVSANTHIFIAEKQTVLSPGSIQIIEKTANQLCYCGCDFIAYRKLSAEVREKIKQLSLQIADALRKENYRGVAGIDFIIDGKNKVYCAEINPRFQASTLLLDYYFYNERQNLDKYEARSCYELNEMAFSGAMITTLHYEDEINYSCYYYYSNNQNSEYFIEKYRQNDQANPEGAKVLSDGMEYYLIKNNIDENSYLFRTIFPHAICSISPEITLWINDNIKVVPKPATPIELKIALLNQGIRLKEENQNIGLETLYPEICKGSYESINITVKNNTYLKEEMLVNCAYKIHLSQYSPFNISSQNGVDFLYYYNERLSEIILEKDMLCSFSDLDKKILYIATDRLRIKLVTGCENKNIGKGCKFCNLPISQQSFTVPQIKNALKRLKNEGISFRHILIGGGSCLSPNVWENIIELCHFLKKDAFFYEKPISLMTMLPPVEMLPQLKEAGIDEVAFNLEIAEDKLAQRLMPGKCCQGKDSYYEVFREAVKIFGIGNVRSALLVGLVKEENLYNEIITLASMGVLPCLSAFRALPNSEFENEQGPSNEYLLKVYQKAKSLLQNQQGEIRELGPRCTACRNNMLII